ncbi:MAG: hypothetical protein AB1768_19530 [Pseudomonadota bacterium]
MTRAIELLRLAAAGLRDIHVGFPHDEIASSNGVGLDRLLRELVQYLRENGIDDEGGLDCDATRNIPVAPNGNLRAKLLAELKADGLTIGECITALAVPNNDPYVKKARELLLGSDDIEIDDNTTISVGENGAFVLSWMWVSNEEAGVADAFEILETIVEFVLEHGEWWDRQVKTVVEKTGEEDLTAWLSFAQSAKTPEMVKYALTKFVGFVETRAIDWLIAGEDCTENDLFDEAAAAVGKSEQDIAAIRERILDSVPGQR